MRNLKVVIIGGGIGGLCLAQGLRKSGINVALHERDRSSSFRRQGYRLYIDPHGHLALANNLPGYLFELFLRTSCKLNPWLLAYDEQLNARGTTRLPSIDSTRQTGLERHAGADRLILRQILIADMEDAVRFNSVFTHYEQSSPAGRITAHFSDGTQDTGDVLVAADGIKSRVRKQYLPHAKVIDSGVWTAAGIVPMGEHSKSLIPGSLENVMTTVVGQDKKFLGLAPVIFPRPAPPVNSRNDYFMCLFAARREMYPISRAGTRAIRGLELKRTVLEMVDEWHPRIRDILSLWDNSTLFLINIRTSVPPFLWKSTNITLLGDAIHAMSPALGAGANTALRDADLLARRLSEASRSERSLAESIAAYESGMAEYAFPIVKASAHNGRLLAGQDPLPDPDPSDNPPPGVTRPTFALDADRIPGL
ncbi:FAD-dependent oxidoreductase [Streptomyces sp. NPDC002659]|uniref:FAD-dependent oxidoreductase n=1 Tax=Streptomyces sp. NPDC002659 TaxID=3364656 RepID=UPI0036AADCCB